MSISIRPLIPRYFAQKSVMQMATGSAQNHMPPFLQWNGGGHNNIT